MIVCIKLCVFSVIIFRASAVFPFGVRNMETFLHEIVVFPIRILAVVLPPHDKVLQCIIIQATENG